MVNKTFHELDGRFLYYTFLAGGNRVLEHQAEINLINVFPVNDKDTGTNLASTIRSVIDNTVPSRSFSETVNNIAEAALIGARGNSGIIFAQFLYGLSMETKDEPAITFKDFAEGVKKSIPYLYESISNPVEGTMLTVIKDWSEFISEKKDKLKDFKKAFSDSIATLEESLAQTTSKLEVLKNTGLVDAGAKGFVVFIEGIIDFIKSNNIRDFIEVPNENTAFVHSEAVTKEVIINRYCTEAVIKNLSISKSKLQEYLDSKGDSTVIAGSKAMTRIHTHTNKPSELFYRLKDFGTITFQKVDDIVRQQEIAFDRKWNIALLTDSTCDLPQDIIDKYQITVMPINLYFGDRHYLDKVTIKPDRFYDMLESETVFPTSSQINETTFVNAFSQLSSHYDAIIAIHLSGNMSGTLQSCQKAAEKISTEFNKPIGVINSKSISGALGLQVLQIAKDIEAGKSFDDIIRLANNRVSDTEVYVSVKTLKYLTKGGRVSKQKGWIANLLGINPIVSIDNEGNSMLMGKAFSQKSSIKKVINHIRKKSKNKEVGDYIVLHAHNPDGANAYTSKMKQLTGKDPVSVINISPVIGMNAGPGTAAVALTIK
jgi:DegV family protein with EDD domain